MTEAIEKTTVPNPSAATDGEQPLYKESTSSITERTEKCKEEDSEDIFARIRRMQNPNYLHTVTLEELYETVYESSPPIVERLLWPGTYLFVGAPKVGKSFMVAQIAYHVSMGIPLWGFPVHPGTVLYLALEDDYQRLQSRLYRMYGTEGTEKLHFAVCAKHLEDGLEGQLEEFVRNHPDTKLVIIDTLQKVREMTTEHYSYASDYALIAKLKEFAGAHKLCMLLVHHTRKQQSDDKFDMISGTNGLLGAADGAFLIQKLVRLKPGITVDVSGRDQQDQRLTFERNPENLRWELENVAVEAWTAPPEPVLEAVAKQLPESGMQWQGQPSQLAELLGLEISPIALTKRLNVNADRLMQDYGIRYRWRRSHEGRIITLQKLEQEA